MLLPLMRCIRQAWNKEVRVAGEFLIIDSFPVPVCQPVRNYRVKIFRGIADSEKEDADYSKTMLELTNVVSSLYDMVAKSDKDEK